MLHNLFYLLQNAIYLTILSLCIQIIQMFSLNHGLKFLYQPGRLNVKAVVSPD
jgi:hypothetical protein